MFKLSVPLSRSIAIVGILILVLVSPKISSPAEAAAGQLLVVIGNYAVDEGYEAFGQATGKEVVKLVELPSDLLAYDCVVLPVNAQLFSSDQKALLSSYINNGGRVLALAEHFGFGSAIATMNDLSQAIGADVSVISDAIDSDFHTTTNIDSSSLTAGVTSIRYAATSEVEVVVFGSAESLVRSIGGTTFIGADWIGNGLFVLSGDSNVFSDNSNDGYINHDNGVLAANICGGGSQTHFEFTAPFSVANVNSWSDPVEKNVRMAALKGLSGVVETQQDVNTGELGYHAYAWGGLLGFYNWKFADPPPTEEAFVQSLMGTDFTAPSAGNYLVRAEVQLTGKAISSSGPGAFDFMLLFVPGDFGDVLNIMGVMKITNPTSLFPKVARGNNALVLKVNSSEIRNEEDFGDVASDSVLLDRMEVDYDGIVAVETTV
jgi:hypothetical protein